jgi:hypothetical protein
MARSMHPTRLTFDVVSRKPISGTKVLRPTRASAPWGSSSSGTRSPAASARIWIDEDVKEPVTSHCAWIE